MSIKYLKNVLTALKLLRKSGDVKNGMSKRRPKTFEEPRQTSFYADPDVQRILEERKESNGSTIQWVANTAIRFWNQHKDKIAA